VRIRAVVFDFDGVLVDSNEVKRQAFFEVFRDYDGSAEVVVSLLASDGVIDRYDVIQGVLSQLEVDLPPRAQVARKLAEEYNAICEHHAATCAEIEGAATALATLAAEYQLFVNSATPEQPLRRIVARRSWDRFFRGVFGRPSTKTENLRRALSASSTTAQDLLFVGDSRSDMLAAREVGCHFVGVRDDEDVFRQHGVSVVEDLTVLPELVPDLLPAA
jgi:phosphoglycolate phosphatase-like HAD superfamily hydrolase